MEQMERVQAVDSKNLVVVLLKLFESTDYAVVRLCLTALHRMLRFQV